MACIRHTFCLPRSVVGESAESFVMATLLPRHYSPYAHAAEHEKIVGGDIVVSIAAATCRSSDCSAVHPRFFVRAGQDFLWLAPRA